VGVQVPLPAPKTWRQSALRRACADIPCTIWTDYGWESTHETALLVIAYQLALYFQIHLHFDSGMYRLRQAANVSHCGSQWSGK